jgi:hypothetical protein
VKVVVRGAVDVFSQDGQDTIALAVMLQDTGVCDVTLMPTRVLPGLPRAVTRLLEKDPFGEKDVVVAVGGVPSVEAVQQYAPKWVLYSDRLTENPSLEDWWAVAAPYPLPVPGHVTVLPRPVDLKRWKPVEREWVAPLRFLTLGEQPEIAALWNMDGAVLDQTVPRTYDQAEHLFRTSHVVLALHPRMERAALEFMATGGVALTPQGPAAVHPDCGLVLPSNRVEEEHLVAAVRHAVASRTSLRVVGDSAARYVAACHGWEAVARKWRQHLSTVVYG